MTLKYYPVSDAATGRTFSQTVRARIVPSPPVGTVTTGEFPVKISRDGDAAVLVNDETNLLSGEVSALVTDLASYPGGWNNRYVGETVLYRAAKQEFRMYQVSNGLKTADWAKEMCWSPAGILYQSDVRLAGTATAFYSGGRPPHDVPSADDLEWSLRNYFNGHAGLASDADSLRVPLLLIDIEVYKTVGSTSSDWAAAGVSSAAEYNALSNAAISTLIDRIKAAAPKVRSANYGLYLPMRSWSGALNQSAFWIDAYTAAAPIINKFDVVTPSLYMGVQLSSDYSETGTDRTNYGTFITRHLDQIARVAPTKKIIPYLWNKTQNGGNDYFMSQACYEVGLRACFAHANCAGVILFHKSADQAHMLDRASSTQLALRAFLANPTGV